MDADFNQDYEGINFDDLDKPHMVKTIEELRKKIAR